MPGVALTAIVSTRVGGQLLSRWNITFSNFHPMVVGAGLMFVTDAAQLPSCLEIETRRPETSMAVGSYVVVVVVVAPQKILLFVWDISFSFLSVKRQE